VLVIDTHHHFWHYTAAEFGWIGDDMAAIRRDFGPDDLAAEMAAHGVHGAVAVQSPQTEAETRMLLDAAGHHAWLLGVVGWVPLTSPDVADRLAHYAADPKLVGVRHIVQAEPDGFLDRDDFNAGVRALRPHRLPYDLLVVARQLPATTRFVDRHPDQPFVLDHLAKPPLDRDELEPWRTDLRELARREHVVCKVSGGITEVDLAWTPRRVRPYLDAALEAFGPRRLMFGSNWPVTEAAGGYGRWVAAVRDWAAPLTHDEQQHLFAGTAVATYSLEVPS